MSDIPLARDMLKCVTEELRAGGDPIACAAAVDMIIQDWMYRTRTKQRAPNRSVPMSAMIGNMVRLINATHPSMSAQQIADKLGVNPGRVSEAIAGKW